MEHVNKTFSCDICWMELKNLQQIEIDKMNELTHDFYHKIAQKLKFSLILIMKILKFSFCILFSWILMNSLKKKFTKNKLNLHWFCAECHHLSLHCCNYFSRANFSFFFGFVCVIQKCKQLQNLHLNMPYTLFYGRLD